MENFDFVVIGGGPGGYVCAIRAAQLGFRTALVEEKHLGGVCLNWGCIPTKALLRSAEFKRMVESASDYGFTSTCSFDLEKIVARSRAIAEKLSRGVAFLLKKNKVTVVDGHARFLNNKTVEVTHNGKSTQYSAKHFVIATGARPRVIKGMEPDGQYILTSKEAMIQKELPASLLVIGSGAIGTEFASFYNTLGSKVTIVEMQSRILPLEDEEISAIAAKEFTKQGMSIHTNAKLISLSKTGSGVVAKIEEGGVQQEIKADKAIVAVGIECNIDDIGLNNTKIRVDRGHIVVDKYNLTDESNIYAIGDVADAPWLAHKASHEGVLVAEHASGATNVHTINKSNIPSCVYSFPQIASIGMTEKAAKEKGFDVMIGRFPFIGNGKALALGDTEGLIKTIFDKKTGELLGAHMVGAEVTELIQGFSIAKSLEATELDLMQTVFPHPTLSEMMHESTLDAYGRAIHI